MDLRVRDQSPRWVPNTNTTCSSSSSCCCCCCCCCNVVVGGNSDRVLKGWFGNEATARGGNRVEDSLLGGVWGSDLWVQMGDLVGVVVVVVGMWALNIHGSCGLCRGCVCVYVCERTCGGGGCGGWCCGGGGGSGLGIQGHGGVWRQVMAGDCGER